MNRIKRQFVGQLSSHRAGLSAIRERIEQDNDIEDALTEARFRAHKLLGTASTLGFGDLGYIAAICEHEMEICLRSHEDGSKRVEPALAAIGQLVKAIDSAASESCSG